jgi:protein-arginine kinase activator protein McsA
MLMGMHRSLQYAGEHPAGSSDRVSVLQKELEEAVAREDYEEAARLRDCLLEAQEVIAGRQGEFTFDEADETAI